MNKLIRGNEIVMIGKVLLASTLGLGILLAGGCSTGKDSTKPEYPVKVESNNEPATSNSYEDIDAAKFTELIKDPNSVVVDVRTQVEYDSGHVAKSLLIPVDIIASNLNKLDKNKNIILVCRSGRRSSTAADILVRNGFTKVSNLVGGLSGNPDLISE